MDVQAIRLQVLSGLHSGLPGIGIEETSPTLGADSLFAALISQLALHDTSLIGPLIETFPRRVGSDYVVGVGTQPFLLTSAFPYAGDVLFFPAPMRALPPTLPTGKPGSTDPGTNKALKKVSFVSETLFRQMLNGEPLTALEKGVVKLQHGEVWLSGEEYARIPKAAKGHLADDGSVILWQTERRPRVAIDRTTNRSNIFYHGETFYQEGCGLWFGLAVTEPARTIGNMSFSDLLKVLIYDFEAVGIGQLRSYGLGQVLLEAAMAITLPDPLTDLVVTLSRFAPTNSDVTRLQHPGASYRMLSIGGRMASSGHTAFQRLQVPMLAEGSTLSNVGVDDPVGGCLVDASPTGARHPAWRYGLSFPVGLAL